MEPIVFTVLANKLSQSVIFFWCECRTSLVLSLLRRHVKDVLWQFKINSISSQFLRHVKPILQILDHHYSKCAKVYVSAYRAVPMLPARNRSHHQIPRYQPNIQTRENYFTYISPHFHSHSDSMHGSMANPSKFP